MATRAEARQTRERSRDRIVAAATELVRHRSYAALTVDDVMREAGFGRTIFYRHFDDLPDLLRRAGREAMVELLDAQRAFGSTRGAGDAEMLHAALAPAVGVYEEHGPLLRAIAEAAGDDERLAAGRAMIIGRFDDLVVEAMRSLSQHAERPEAQLRETAHALNLMNEAYLLDAFGRAPRISAEGATRTLVSLWSAIILPGRA